MISIFINHELKDFWRSKNTGKSIAIRIVLGLVILYLFANLFILGLFLDTILEKVFPKDDLVISFCGLILLYYLVDLFMRLQLQELPTLRVQPYLQLPVKRNALIQYLAFTALLSIFNLWPFVLFAPFIIKIIATDSGPLVSAAFIVSLAGLTIFNNYLSLYIKRKSNLNGWVFLISAATIILIGLSDFYLHLFSIRKLSFLFFGNLITHPLLAVLPVLGGLIMYYINFLYLKQNLYLEELSRKTASYKSSTEYPLLSRFGSVGDLAANEIKLILRNKRSRSALIMGMFILLYGLIIYTNPSFKNGDSMKIFVSMLMAGIFIINYGQFMFSWQGPHFDGLLVSRISFSDFIKAKYLLFTLISTFFLVLTIPYMYFGWKILLIQLIMYLWNIGVNTTMVLFFANRNYKRIDLSRGAAFNWEGISGNQWILSFPLMITPFLIYAPFALLGHANIGLGLLAFTGLIGVFTRNFWIRQLETDFYTKRYKIAEGFRNK